MRRALARRQWLGEPTDEEVIAAIRSVPTHYATLIIDQFARTADLNGSTPSPTNMPGNTWSVLSGAFATNGSYAYFNSADTRGDLAVVNAGVSDCTITVNATIITNNTYPGIVFRCQDANNFWTWFIDRGDGLVILREFVAGSQVLQMVSSQSIALNTPYTLSVVLSGTSITCYYQGTNVVSTTSSDFETATNHGLYNLQGDSNQWTDFEVDGSGGGGPAPGTRAARQTLIGSGVY